MGKAVKSIGKVAAAPVTGGLSLMGGGGKIKDVLFGAKDPGVADRHAVLDKGLYDITKKTRPLQSKSIDLYKKRLGELGEISSGGLADLMTKRKVNQLAGAAEDAERIASREVAKRGLGRSSVGLNSIVNAGSTAREAMADARAMTPILKMRMGAERDAQLANLNRGLAGILGTRDQSRAFIQGRESTGRGGGLLGIATGALGAYGAAQAGGNPAAGFQGGMAMGNAVGNMRLS